MFQILQLKSKPKNELFKAEMRFAEDQQPIKGLDKQLASRLKYMGINQKHLDLLQEIKPVIMELADEVLDTILDHLYTFDELDQIASSHTTRDRLKHVFVYYFQSVFGGPD